MRFVLAIIFCVLGSGFTLAAAQREVVSSAVQSPAAAAQSTPGARQDDILELRKDVQKMRVLVRQMEMNLAFVDTTQTPLKHQFQLEIDMWKTVIDQMERRLEASNPH